MKLKIILLSFACSLSVLTSTALLADDDSSSNTENMNVNVTRNDIHAFAAPGSQLMKEEEQMMHDKRLSSMVGDDPNNYKLQDEDSNDDAAAAHTSKHSVGKKHAKHTLSKAKQKIKNDIVADEATK